MLADLERRLEKFGVSGDGRDWLIRALHPAGESKCLGLPDESSFSVLRPEYRVQTVIPPLASDNGAYDLFLWSPPGDVNAVVWAAAPSPADFTNPLVPPGSAFGAIHLQPTIDLPGSIVFNTPGAADTSFSFRVPTAYPLSFRHIYKSVTTTLIASAVSDQGEVYAAQFPPAFSWGQLTATGVLNAVSANQNIAVSSVCRIPLDEASLMLMSPECYVGPARDGAYLPLRLAGPAQLFTSTPHPLMLCRPLGGSPPYLATTDTNSVAIPALMTVSQSDDGNSDPAPWVVRGLLGPDVPPFYQACDTGYDCTNVGVTIFRGLASGGGGGGFGASVLVKVIVGLEVVPQPTSPDRIFCKPAITYDPRAIQAYYAVALELRDAYPASFNALGSILGVISSVAAKIFGPLLGFAKAAAPAILPTLGVEAARHLMGAPPRLLAPQSAPRGEVAEASAPRVTYVPQPRSARVLGMHGPRAMPTRRRG
jgi:hypothetical protein